jgi:hypothetical protein
MSADGPAGVKTEYQFFRRKRAELGATGLRRTGSMKCKPGPNKHHRAMLLSGFDHRHLPKTTAGKGIEHDFIPGMKEWNPSLNLFQQQLHHAGIEVL